MVLVEDRRVAAPPVRFRTIQDWPKDLPTALRPLLGVATAWPLAARAQ